MNIIYLSTSLLAGSATLFAASTIDPVHRYAYSANAGWVDWLADSTNGAVIGSAVCSGFIYAANLGWIHLGDGSPANGAQYQNTSATDYGVNLDEIGCLRGFAYGANIGWIQFEPQGNPHVDQTTGQFHGYAYGANIGWICLNNALGCVKTLVSAVADSDGDGIDDSWEIQHAGDLARFGARSDADGDGTSDREEFYGDTDPLDPNSRLRITAYETGGPNSPATLTWTSRPTRRYQIERQLTLNGQVQWYDFGLGIITPSLGFTSSRAFMETPSSTGFYRVRAFLPVSP